MQDSSIYSILSLTPVNDILVVPDMKCDQDNVSTSPTPPSSECRIRQRSIFHPSLKKSTKKNGNMPKSIIGNFHKYIHKYSHLYSSEEQYEDTKNILKAWLKQRFDIGLPQLFIVLGGQSRQNMDNCRVLREIFSNQSLDMIGEHTKVTNNLSYLICFEKYVYRLANPSLAGRIQSR